MSYWNYQGHVSTTPGDDMLHTPPQERGKWKKAPSPGWQSKVRLSANLSWLFKEVPFLERFEAASTCGFRVVEFGDLDSTCGDAGAVRVALGTNSLSLALINISPGDQPGDRGLAGIPDREQEWVAQFNRVIRFANDCGCTRIHILAGTVEKGADEATYVKRLQWGAKFAAELGLVLLVEPLNPIDFPGYLIPDAETALRVIEAVDAPNCRLQLDLYHLAKGSQLTTQELVEEVKYLLPHAAHVQVATPPDRHEPGMGDIDFDAVLSMLDDLGYNGFVGLEYRPSASTVESLQWAKPFGVRTEALGW